MNHDEDVLRRILEAEASTVEVRPDALPRIRRKIRSRRSRWSPRGRLFLATWGAAAGVAGAVAAAVVIAGGGPPTVAPQPPQPPAGSVTAPPSGPPASTAPPPATPVVPNPPPVTGPAATASLAVYYVGVDRQTAENGTPNDRPRLYREFRRLPAGDAGPVARTRAALTEMFAHRTAADPDYANPWPADSRVRDIRVDADTVTVDLAGAGANGVGAETARLAVQQLVWTATAASERTDVRLLLDGRPADQLWGQVPVGGALRRAPMADVVAAVWLISPQHGDTVGRTFDVHIAGIVFEATVYLRVRRAGAVVDEQFLTLSAGPPQQGEGKIRLTLEPGTYVLEAYATSAADGSVQHLDNHTVSVA